MSGATEGWTIRGVVRWAETDFRGRGIASARLDAELLVAHALGLDRVRLYMDLDRPLVPAELAEIRGLVVRRRRREPVAYILGQRELWGRSFDVTPAVLVPRPETETLIEHALALPTAAAPLRALDLCTGSGCIGVTLAAERPDASVVLSDLSAAALEVARRNAEKHGVAARVELREGDLFAVLGTDERFDLVTANPPYLAEAELATCAPDVREHEPRVALVAGPAGDELLVRLARGVRAHLAPGGHVLSEIGAGQGPRARALFEAAGLAGVEIVRDLAGLDRVVVGRAP